MSEYEGRLKTPFDSREREALAVDVPVPTEKTAAFAGAGRVHSM